MECLLALSGVAGAAAAGAAPAAPDDDAVRNAMASSFAMPFGQFLDGTAEESLSLRLAFDMPMAAAQAAVVGSGNNGGPPSSPTLQLGLKYVPLASWFLSVNFARYVRPALQKPWNPDFTYVFGYDDWHPYTFSAQYANYGGNRLRPDASRGERRTTFLAGSWSAAFKFPMPEALNDIVLIDPEHTVGCAAGLSFTPRYSDLASNSVKSNKRSASFGCKYGFAGYWYFNFAVSKALVKSQKQPWDPDYTYGFGYADWHPGTLSIQYNNYSGNRFPWNPPSPGTGRFRNGSITLGIGFTFN
jgi:hypothetical protein